MKNTCWLITLILVIMSCSTSSKSKQNTLSYDSYLLVGTYTHQSSEGLYLLKFSSETGAHELSSSLKIDNPSFITLSSDESKLYVASENEDITTDCVSVVQFDKKNATLELLQSELTEGTAPCYVLADNSLNLLVSANYGGGSLSFFNLNSNGLIDKRNYVRNFKTAVGPNKVRQDAPHLHCAYLSPDNKYLFANDLGADCIYQYAMEPLDPSSNPIEIKLEPGSGPRHTVFHPNKKWAYTITELSGEVLAFNYTGESLELFQTILADPNKAQGSGDIQITPDGKFLYASNRLVEDGIAIFSIGSNGELTFVGYEKTGIHPRNMGVDPKGKFLLVACRDSNAIEVYAIDEATGLLSNTNQDIEINMPVCVKFASMNAI